MSSGDKRIGTSGDSMPFGTEVMCVGNLLQAVATPFNIYVPVGMGAIRVKKVRSFVTVALTTAKSDVAVASQHASDGAVAMTGSPLVIAHEAAVGDEDSCPVVNDAKAIVPEGDKIVLTPDGAAGAGEALFFIEYERCQ